MTSSVPFCFSSCSASGQRGKGAQHNFLDVETVLECWEEVLFTDGALAVPADG